MVHLPHGFASNGSWIRKVELRPLNGFDEQYVAEIIDLPAFIRTTHILQRVITFRKTIHDRKEAIRHLTIGDRIYLLLHLRMLTFGNNLPCVLGCPSCKESMSLDLSINDLLQKSKVPQSPNGGYSISVDNFSLKLRPICGADQELIYFSEGLHSDDNDYDYNHDIAEKLVRSCIIFSDPPLSNDLSQDFISKVSSRLEGIDPHADLILEFSCPACQRLSKVSFNSEEFIFNELDALKEQLEREVHWLAFNYHWSEDAILSLIIQRRKRYVDLVNKTLAGEDV